MRDKRHNFGSPFFLASHGIFVQKTEGVYDPLAILYQNVIA
jgi:hypothetical protein